MKNLINIETVNFLLFFIVIVRSDNTNYSKKSKSPAKDQLMVYLNPELKIHFVANTTSATVPLLDWTRNLSAIYDGKTRAAFIFDFETAEGVYLPPESTDKTWSSAKQSLNDYFDNLDANSQQEMWHLGETRGVKFNPYNISDDISEKISGLLDNMSQYYSSQCEGLDIFLQISRLTANSLRSSMSDYTTVVGRGGKVETPIRGDMKSLIGAYVGMGEFYQHIPEGMGALVKRNINLDLSKILAAPTGVHVFIYFFESLAPLDIGQFIAPTFNDELKFFVLTNKMIGESFHGFDGFFNVITEIVKFNFGQSSLQNVESVLRKYFERIEEENDVRETWNSAINDLSRSISKLGLNLNLDKMAELLENIINGRWFQNGKNMSLITEIIFETTDLMECLQKMRDVLSPIV